MAPKARGELGEIKTTLATLATTGNAKSEAVVASKREVFKKIINYMTIGIDMSSLFMQARPLCAGHELSHYNHECISANGCARSCVLTRKLACLARSTSAAV